MFLYPTYEHFLYLHLYLLSLDFKTVYPLVVKKYPSSTITQMYFQTYMYANHPIDVS